MRFIPGAVVAAVLTGTLFSAVQAGDFAIVPGKRLGQVALGMTPSMVHERLNAPLQTRHSSGLVQEEWLGSKSSDARIGRAGQHRLLVTYRNGQVVQIEATAPQFATADGISPRKTVAQMAPRLGPGIKTSAYAMFPTDGPNAKHYFVYADNRAKGVAWRAGVWTGLSAELAPDNRLESVIVHPAGQAIIPEIGSKAGGAATYLIKDLQHPVNEDQ